MKQTRKARAFGLLLAGVLLLVGVLPFAAVADEAMVTDKIVMTTGASIRTAENYGIRFEATVAADFIETWGESAVYGMLIAPENRIGGDFTLESMAAGNYVNAVSKGWSVENADGSKVFRVALVDLPKTYASVNMKFAARAYAVVTDTNGEQSTMYAPYNSGNNRSLYDVAKAYRNMAGYEENGIVESILDVGILPTYSYIKSDAAGGDYMTVAKDSVTYGAGVTALDSNNMNTETMVSANLALKPGMKVEFDLDLLASGKPTKAYFWLGDPSKNMTEGENAFAKMQIYEYGAALQVGRVGIAGAGAWNIMDTKEVAGGAGSLHWDQTKERICFYIKDSNTVVVTISERNNTGYYTETITTTAPITDARLCFGTAALSYKVSNLTVTEVGTFDTISGSGADYVTIEKNSVTYGAGVPLANNTSMETQPMITASENLKVGTKVEFDLDLLSYASGHTNQDCKMYFWLGDPNKDMTKGKNAFAITQIYVYGNGLQVGRIGISGASDWNAMTTTDTTTTPYQNLHWGVTKLHITYEIQNSTTVVLTISERDKNGSYSQTITTTEITDARLCFGTAALSYKVSNLTVTEIG